MRDVLKTEELDIPEGVTIEIKSRLITVKGPRGTLTKNVRHIDMDIRIQKGKTDKVCLAVWQGGRKHVACLRTIKSLIVNMITGVTKVCRPYELWCNSVRNRMSRRASNTRCVPYMPTSQSTALSKTAVARWRSVTSWARRSVAMSGLADDLSHTSLQIVRNVAMLEGVTVSESKAQKDELILEGTDVQNVSQSGEQETPSSVVNPD